MKSVGVKVILIGSRSTLARCSLATDVFGRWGWPVFNGLHMILGFHTTCSDEPDRGRLLAQYLNAGWTVRQAWIRACQDTEDSDVTWAYLRADGHGTDTYNDHWWGKGHVSEDPDHPTSLFYARARLLRLRREP